MQSPWQGCNFIVRASLFVQDLVYCVLILRYAWVPTKVRGRESPETVHYGPYVLICTCVLIWYCSIPISIYIPVLAQIRKGLSKRSKYIEKYLQHDREGIVIRWRYNTARAAHVRGQSVNWDSCARQRGVCPRRNEEMCSVWYLRSRERSVRSMLSQNLQSKNTIIWIPWHCIHWFIKRMIRKVIQRSIIYLSSLFIAS